MARAELSVQNIVAGGLEASYTAVAADGHEFQNNGEEMFLHVKNGATAMVITLSTPRTVDGLAVADKTISIGSNEEHFIGPLPAATYNQSDGLVHVDYDDVSDGTIAALKLPRP